MHHKINTIILLTILLAACASKQRGPEFSEYLATNIRSDGSKEFQYTVEITHSDSHRNKKIGRRMGVTGGSGGQARGYGGITVGGNSGGGKHRGGPGKNGQGGPDTQMIEQVDQQLEKALSRSGYCREGWMEVERDYQPPKIVVKGECNESATEKDRRHFPNSEDT